MKFKVGDNVKAVSNNTVFTSERMKWAGVVTKVEEDGFSAKTTKHLLLATLDVEFDCLDYNDFELETKEKAKEADEEETEQDSLIGELNEEEKKKDQIGKDKSTGEIKITHRKSQMKR